MMKLLNPKMKISEQTKMISLCYAMLPQIEVQIQAKLTQCEYVSLGLDVWISRHQQAFLKVNAYYIDDNWQYQELLLSFKPLTNCYTGWELALITMKFLQKYKLQHQLLAITTNNAKSNITLWECLHAFLNQDYHILWSHKKDTICCITHIIQLILNAVFGKLKVVRDDDLSEEKYDRKTVLCKI